MNILTLSLITIMFIILVYLIGWCLGGGAVFFTIFSGVMVFVIGQITVKLVIDPIQDMKKTIGQISYSMHMYANVISNPGFVKDDLMHKTSDELRKLSSQLRSILELIPRYDYLAKIFSLPSRKNILSASDHLIGLSNGVFSKTDGIHEKNAKKVERVCDSLGIYLSEDQRWPK